jgi:hypothetical protein
MSQKFLVNVPNLSFKDSIYHIGDVIEIDDEYYAKFKDSFDKHKDFNHIVLVDSSEMKHAEQEMISHAQEVNVSDEQIEKDADKYVDSLKKIIEVSND